MMFVFIQRVYKYALWLIVTCGLLLDTVNSDLVLVCPDGWHKHNTQCYWFSDFKATRDDAKIECEARNSSLVTISTSNINNFLQQHISNKTNYWIGLKIDIITDTYKWQWSNGQKAHYSHYRFINWCNGHTVGTACAAAVYSNTEPHICYESYNCGTTQRYVCEKEKLDVSSCPDGWDEITYATQCYYISSYQLNNMDAARFCWSHGARLITVTYAGPNNYLRDKRPGPNEVYWIGISPYKWDDGTPYNWNNWDNAGPSIGVHCTLLQPDGTWYYGPCSNEFQYFICQIDATLTTTTTTAASLTTMTSSITTRETTSPETKSFTSSEIPTTSNLSITMITNIPIQLTTVYTTHSSTVANGSSYTDMLLVKPTSTFGENTFFTTTGILSAVIVCLTIAVVALVVYIKRRLQMPKQPASPNQDTPYEDVSAAAYYNVNVGVNVGNQSLADEHRDDNVDEHKQIGLPDYTYEELAKGPYVNNYKQQTTAGTYATLD